MLVTFNCEAHENITMFGDVAVRILKMMDHSGTVPGAILAKDVPAALSQLQGAIEQEKNKPSVTSSKKISVEDDDEEPCVSIVHRALPLIELLQSAVNKKCDVMWK